MAKTHSVRSLVSRARAGDREAFDQLAARYRERLLQSIRGRLLARKDALCDSEDILNETLLRAFERVRGFEWQGEDSFLRWLHGISRNLRLHELRRKRAVLSLDAAEDCANGDLSPSRTLQREERFERLERAIASLPPKYQEVVRLSRIQGLKTADVAKRLRTSPDSVKHLLARAIQQLRRRLDETGSLRLPDRQLDPDGDRDGE